MSEEGEFDTGEDCLEDDDSADCDYSLTEFCIDPALRSIGSCFECSLYLDSLKEDLKAEQKPTHPINEVQT